MARLTGYPPAPCGALGGAAVPSPENGGVVVLCLEAGEWLTEPMCSTSELQQELVPYVLSHLLRNADFIKLSKEGRKARVKALTQQMLGGEFGGASAREVADAPAADADGVDVSPARFWAHLRAKYGTRQGHLLKVLGHLEARLRATRVVVLRFEGEVAVPSASLLVRASAACGGGAHAALAPQCRLEFPAGDFSVAALGAWMEDAAGAGAGRRFPPLWTRLAEECRQRGCSTRAVPPGGARAEEQALVLLLCTEPQSTDTAPDALAIAGHVLHRCCDRLPCLSGVTFGSFDSERLAALEELCAWAGGLSINVGEPAMLQTAADCLSAHLFGGVQVFGERREFYLMKQKLGTCFIALPVAPNRAGAESRVGVSVSTPASTSAAAEVSAVTRARARPTNLQELLGRDVACAQHFDGTAPSDRMLAVLSDTSLAILRRWSRGLRCWREHRGLRDVVFAEPGGLGLELDEPDAGGEATAAAPAGGAEAPRGQWRLRATHPPASALKMELGSILVAINQTRVHTMTPRSEVSRRASMRPVSLTFASPERGVDGSGAAERNAGADFASVVSEIAVAELREGFKPIMKSAPPLSVAVQRIGDARRLVGRRGPRRHQADRLLADVAAASASLASSTGESADGATAASSSSASASCLREPNVLYRVMLFAGGVHDLAHCGQTCARCRGLVLANARRDAPAEGGPHVLQFSTSRGSATLQQRLWTWVVRWGAGPQAARRLGFWRWLLACGSTPQGTVGENGDADPPTLAVVAGALRADAAGLLQLSGALAGSVPGAAIGAIAVSRLAESLGNRGPTLTLPGDVLEALLRGPFYMQQAWMLTVHSLPWLARQGRIFQVMLAAACPDLFKHLVAEGVPPELFYTNWLQTLLYGALEGELRMRVLDMFMMERSYKVFVRVGIAVFALLENRLRRCDVDGMMKILFDAPGWNLDADIVLEKMLETKVTRSMFRAVEQVDDASSGL